jgi:putative peptidoglycan lipid II flippase
MKPSTPQPDWQAESRGIAFSAAIMASGTMMSRVLGLFRDIITAAYFDRTVTDAWIVAFRLPNLFRRMLGEGSFSISFIPIFIDTIAKEGPLESNKRARELINGLFTLLLCILTVLTALGVIFSEEILNIIVGGEGFMAVPDKFAITVYMARIMFGFIFFISLFAYFMAILNSFKKFAAAAFAPTLFNVSMILSALFTQKISVPGDTLAWAVLFGGFLQMAFLIPALIKINALPKFSAQLWSPDIARVFRGLIPSWIGVGILQITALINVRLGSELGEGTHSWIYLADRILELPLSLVAVSMSSALLPTLSQLWAHGQKEEMVATSEKYLRATLFLTIPAAVGVYILAEPIVTVLFNYGRFSPKDIEMTSSLLRIYSIAILTYGGIRVIVSPFYAIKNTWLPAAVAAVCLIIHYLLASNLIYSWGVQGITASSVISSAVNLSMLIVCHSAMIGKFHLKVFAVSLSKYFVAAAGMAAVLMIYNPFYEALFSVIGMPKLAGQITLALVVSSGGATYFAISYFLKAEGMEEIVGKIRRRLKL